MIKEFQGEYRWLSNFWPARIEFEGIVYPTVEHAYVAAKTLDQGMREVVARQSSPGKAKRFGRTFSVRSDWDGVKLRYMEMFLRQKFSVGSELAEKLTATGDMLIQEGNTWGDRFWGVCRGQGENHLGRILMKIRSEL